MPLSDWHMLAYVQYLRLMHRTSGAATLPLGSSSQADACTDEASLVDMPKGLLDGATPSSAPPEASDDYPVWCVAANVRRECDYGPDGVEKRRGTKQLAPGAKVFVYYFYWRKGGERVIVIGRQRKSHRYIRLTMPAKHLIHWRAELVYSPYIARQIRAFGEFAGQPAYSDYAKRLAENIVDRYTRKCAQLKALTRP